MAITTAFLAHPESSLGARVAARERGTCGVLDTLEPRVLIEDGVVSWNGTRLDRLEALIVETPIIAWPQPIAQGRAGEPYGEMQRRGIAHRERRALHVAALRLVAGRVRVANHPTRGAELAMSPALALDRLTAAGMPVRPWRVAPTASVVASASPRTVRAAMTAERGLAPADGATCLAVELAISGAARHLCVGGDWLAATRACLELAPRGEALELDAEARVDSTDREVAIRALAELGLEFGCVHVCAGAVAFVETAVDLDAWDRASDGRVAAALANWLTRVPQPTR